MPTTHVKHGNKRVRTHVRRVTTHVRHAATKHVRRVTTPYTRGLSCGHVHVCWGLCHHVRHGCAAEALSKASKLATCNCKYMRTRTVNEELRGCACGRLGSPCLSVTRPGLGQPPNKILILGGSERPIQKKNCEIPKRRVKFLSLFLSLHTTKELSFWSPGDLDMCLHKNCRNDNLM